MIKNKIINFLRAYGKIIVFFIVVVIATSFVIAELQQIYYKYFADLIQIRITLDINR